MAHTYSFEKLLVWQKMKSVCLSVYKLSEGFPKSEMYGLSSQIRRSSISVCSNIAVGTGRESIKEQGHFYKMAYSSLMELVNQLILVNELGFSTEVEYIELRTKIDEVAKMLLGLKGHLQRRA